MELPPNKQFIMLLALPSKVKQNHESQLEPI
jgi:hypothetical protein